MWLIICWLFGLRYILINGLIALTIIITAICYKIFGSSQAIRQQVSITQSHIRDRFKLIMMQAARSGQANLRYNIRRYQQTLRPTDVLNRIAIVLIISIASLSARPLTVNCLEQDAQILTPVASLAKGVIKTATLGVPLEVNFEPSHLVKNFAYFTWRTGFPVTMPSGFMVKAQDFYNRVRLRVHETDVKDVERKTLANLRNDLDDIVDAIVEQVRNSPDGLYTDYLQTRVKGVPIEDACTKVGVQLKAYGVDLTNYRNIAGMVLGIPVMPTVASTMMNVASLAPNLDRLRNITQNMPLNESLALFNQIPTAAIRSMSHVSGSAFNSIDQLRQRMLPPTLMSPFSSILGRPSSSFVDANQMQQVVTA